MGKTAAWSRLLARIKTYLGDDYCGDDGVADTPKQAGYNIECPSGINVTWKQPVWRYVHELYDLTNDGCMNLFTQDKKPAWDHISAGGAAMVFFPSWTEPADLWNTGAGRRPEMASPAAVVPNRPTNQFTLDLICDVRWLGKVLHIINLQGQTVMTLTIFQ